MSDIQDRAGKAALLAAQGHRAAAISEYERILADIESGVRYFGEADLRSDFASLLHQEADPREVAQLTRAAALFQQQRNVPRVIQVCLRLAFLHRNSEASALYWVDRAVKAAEGQADLGQLSDSLACRGELLAAFGHAKEAVAALEKAVRLPGGDAHRDALASARILAGQTREGLDALTQSLNEAEHNNSTARAVVLRMRLADAKQQLGDRAGALQLLKSAAKQHGELADDGDAPMLMDRLGLVLLGSGDAVGAVKTLELGIERALAIQPPDRALLASLYNNLGNALSVIGNTAGAERALAEAWRLARAAHALKTEAESLFNLANLAGAAGDTERAREAYEEARALAMRLRDSRMEAACLDSLGQLLCRVHQPGKAVDLHRRAAQLHAEVADHEGRHIDLLNLVQAHLLLGEIAAARRALDEARVVADTFLKQQSWQQALHEGQVSARENCWPRARQAFDAAIQRLEAERAGLDTPSDQRRWAAKRIEAFEIAAAAAFEARDALGAWSYLEGNRTRFLEAVSDRRRRLPRGLPAETARRYVAATDRLAELRWRRRQRPEVPDAALQSELDRAERTWQELEAEVEPLRATEDRRPPLAARPEQLAECLSPGEVAIALHVTERWIGAACVGRGRDGNLWWDCDTESGLTLAQLSRAVVGRGGAGEARIRPAWLDLPNLPAADAERLVTMMSALLADVVWPLVERVLRGRWTDALVLMPGRGLNVLPLHAAPTADGRFAIDRWSVRYAPSLTLLARAGRPGVLPSRPVLGQVINPTGDLPFAEIEARAVRESWRGDVLDPLRAEHALPDRVLPIFEQVDMLHFAGHGAFDPDDPLQSRLRCAPSASGGVVTLQAILERVAVARARVVVLSACETGRVTAGDALNDQLGLPGGMLISGVSAVLATYWHVDDLAASLMLARCIELWERNGLDLERALAEAQAWLRTEATIGVIRAWIEDRLEASGAADPQLEAAHGWLLVRDENELPFGHPLYWAPFHVTGRAVRVA